MLVFLCLLAFVTPLIVVTPFQDQWALPKLATTAAITGAALLWGAVLLARDRWPAGRWPATVWLPVALFVVANMLALFFAVDWRASLMGERLRYQGLLTTLVYAALFVVAAAGVRTTRDLRWLLAALFLGALGAAIYGLMQRVDLASWPDPLPDRPGSTLGQANAFGAFLVAAAGASAFLVVTARARWQQAAVAAGLAVLFLALGFTVSRSAYIAAAVVVFAWGIAAGRWLFPAVQARWRIALDGGVVAVALLPLVLAVWAVFFLGLPQGRIAVIGDANNGAVEARLGLWQMGLEMTNDRPLLGRGQDSFAVLFPRYRDRPDLPGIGTADLAPESAHNFFVDLLSGTGALGLFAFLALVAGVLVHAGRRALASDDGDLRLALLALGAAIAGYLTALFFSYAEAASTWLLWLLLGATAGLTLRAAPALRREGAEAEPEYPSLASGLGAVGLALVGTIALVWAGTLVASDLSAGQAERAAQRGEHVEAARLYGRSATLNPFERSYLESQAREHVRASTGQSEKIRNLERAIELYERLLARYEPQAFDVFRLAEAELSLARLRGRPFVDAIDEFERAVELDPYNRELRAAVISVYEREGLEREAGDQLLAIWCWSQCE